MKILYLSHQKEQSGYGRYCREFLRALKTSVEVASFPVKLGKAGNFTDSSENEPLNNCDICIQNILPHLMSKGNMKCIGGAILESRDVDKNYWGSYLEMMDEIIYPHYPLGIFKNEQEILTAIDVDKYIKKYQKMNISEADGTYKFYWIGEASKRKNLSGLITAYYLTFSSSDPVSLILKVHDQSFDSQTCRKNIEGLAMQISRGLKLYKDFNSYPKIIIIPDYWEDERISSLHEYCDCFVSGSFGESICYPVLDAMGFNNQVLSTATFATESYSKHGQMKISYSDSLENCYGQVETFFEYQSAREKWNSFNQEDFSRQLRQIYETRPVVKNDVSGLSYTNVGKKIKEYLEQVLENK